MSELLEIGLIIFLIAAVWVSGLAGGAMMSLFLFVERHRYRYPLRDMVAELVDAMRRYQMDADEDQPFEHREMIRKAEELLKRTQD